jgi:O-antigen/teichoic acid export membrane protein
MQSGLHFGLNIALLRVLSPHDYGVFAIVMVIGGLGLTYIRALTAMPAAIRIGRSRSRGAADAYDVTFGSFAFVLSVLIGLSVAGVLRLWLDADAVAGGLFVGLWSLRSHLRTAIFARGRATEVAVGDMAFTLSGAAMAAALLLLLPGGNRLQGAFTLLALANGLGIAVMLAAGRRKLRISLRASIRRRYGSMWRQLGWSGLSVTTANLQGQGMALLVAAIAGPAAYAPIAAAIVLFVPLRLVGTAVVNMMQPVVAAHLARGESAVVWRLALTWTAVVAGGCLLYGSSMMIALPLLRARVFDGTPLYVIGGFAWAVSNTTMSYVMPRITLEVFSAFRVITGITAAAAVIGMAIAAMLLEITIPAWSMLGLLISELIVLAGSWVAMRRLLDTGPARIIARVYGRERFPQPGAPQGSVPHGGIAQAVIPQAGIPQGSALR